MTVELEEFAQWRHGVEARLGRLEVVSDEHVDEINNQRGPLDAIHADLGGTRGYFVRQQGMLQALHLTQNEQSAKLRGLQTGQEELGQVQGKVLAGVQMILELLRTADDGDRDGGCVGA